jgi:nicotinate-nucleotide adenylyltransferase
MRQGIFGGTFNPIHIGHLIVAQDALDALKLDRVLFIPSATPPHKTPEALAPAEDRLRMIKAAIAGNKRFAVSDIEINRGGPSYSIDTLRTLRKRQPSSEWFFIIGADSLVELHKWKDIDELAKLCAFAVVGRPRVRIARTKLRLPKSVSWRQVDSHLIDISSTEIRQRARTGQSIRYLVPDAVVAYIHNRSLYR